VNSEVFPLSIIVIWRFFSSFIPHYLCTSCN
jgi:hypothetical protein